jgi:hypothetical protein
MIFMADGTVYTGKFVAGNKEGFGVEKTPDGVVYEGPFMSGRRHGVGLVTTVVPVTVDPSKIWDGAADAVWIRRWTSDVPTVQGDQLKVCWCAPVCVGVLSASHRAVCERGRSRCRRFVALAALIACVCPRRRAPSG